MDPERGSFSSEYIEKSMVNILGRLGTWESNNYIHCKIPIGVTPQQVVVI